MDLEITRWLESVPLPPELPLATRSHFRVALASDLSRLRWVAYGAPQGFVPKMSEYLQKCGIGAHDLALINGLGEALAPELVGSWVAVIDGAIRTGWQFCEVQKIADLEPHLGQQDVTAQLMEWVSGNGITEFRRFSQAVGKEPFSEIDLVLPGDTVAEQMDLASAAFRDLFGGALDDYVVTAMSAAEEAELSLVMKIAGGGARSLSVCCPSVGNDVAASLCNGAGASFDDKHVQIQGVLGAKGIDRLEYRRDANNDLAQVDLHLVPGVIEKGPEPRTN